MGVLITRTSIAAGGESPSFDAQLLYTSQDMSFNNGDVPSNTDEWRTAEAEGYARIGYNATGFSGLIHDLVNTTSPQIYVAYSVRRHEAATSKQLKINGFGTGEDRNNCTFGPTAFGYSDDEAFLYWGDAVSGGNDNNATYNLLGSLVSGSLTRAAATDTYSPARVFQDVTGTVWERYAVFALFNSIGAKDGRFGVARYVAGSWERIFQFDDVYNCSDDANARYRDYVGIGEYTGNGTGFIEDYKRVDISTSYVPPWMT